MEKRIIISENAFHKILHLMKEGYKKDFNEANFQNTKTRYDKLFKSDPTLTKSITEDKIKDEMDSLVDMIYSVYESVTHANNDIYDGNPTNFGPNMEDYPDMQSYIAATKSYNTSAGKSHIPTGKTKAFSPGIFYLSNQGQTTSTTDRKNFYFTTRSFYTMIARTYADGQIVWANLFFNPKYKTAKKVFLNCIAIAKGTLIKMGVGVPDQNNNYPEGTPNWVRAKKKAENASGNIEFLSHDIEPFTTTRQNLFSQYTTKDLLTKLNTLLKWKRENSNHIDDFKKYFVEDTTDNKFNTDIDLSEFNF